MDPKKGAERGCNVLACPISPTEATCMLILCEEGVVVALTVFAHYCRCIVRPQVVCFFPGFSG